jgi:hypothetical protein
MQKRQLLFTEMTRLRDLYQSNPFYLVSVQQIAGMCRHGERIDDKELFDLSIRREGRV